jgi:ssDNA-binding Zn-finger/Zn-ribbon topoisomerase 1
MSFDPEEVDPQDLDFGRVPEDESISDSASEVPTGFDSLVESALDFLNRGVQEIDLHPKYSVIHFYTGIELLLKARLLHEHWSLVVAKPGEVSKQKFSSGDFESVTVRQCLDRLDRVCEESMAEEKNCFLSLAAHRNRLIHFFHDTYKQKPDPQLLAEIAIQQLRAGAFLFRLVRHRWKPYFKKYAEEFRQLERSLHGHEKYLQAKLELVRPALNEFQAKGGAVWRCFFCHMPSAEVTEHERPLKTTRCLVCDWSRGHIIMECPECAEGEVEFDVGQGTCEECGTSFDMEFLLQEFGQGEAYCPECSYSNEKSVVPHGDGYLCLSCATDYDRVGTCEWCNEDVAGDTSDSYLGGCMFCDGLIGHEKDD